MVPAEVDCLDLGWDAGVKGRFQGVPTLPPAPPLGNTHVQYPDRTSDPDPYPTSLLPKADSPFLSSL